MRLASLGTVCFVSGAATPTATIVDKSSLLHLYLSLKGEKYLKKSHRPQLFIKVGKIPMNKSGEKWDYKEMALLAKTLVMAEVEDQDEGLPGDFVNKNDSKCKQVVFHEIKTQLNLQTCQLKFLTSQAQFSDLGGDSLSATRICRGILAEHAGVKDSRFLGGERGEVSERAFLKTRAMNHFMATSSTKLTLFSTQFFGSLGSLGAV